MRIFKFTVLIILFICFSVSINVFAATCSDSTNVSDRINCLKEKYSDLSFESVNSNCNLTKEQCDGDSTCIWLDKNSIEIGNNSCGIKQNSTIGYTCKYARDFGSTGVYIVLNMNSAWFNSGYFYTSGSSYVGYRDKIAFPDYIENSEGTFYEDKNGEMLGVVWYCPPVIYYESQEKSDSEGKYYERKIFTEPGEGRNEVKLLIDNAEDYDSTYKYIMAIEPNESSIDVKEPLTCPYNNITAGSVRNISLTYVSNTEITAEYVDDSGLVKNYNVDAIYDSQAFKDWKCVSSDKVYTQVVDENGNLVLYIAYDKDLLPDPDASHEFSPSGNESVVPDKTPDTEVGTCDTVPEVLRKYITDALKLIRWIGLVAMIVLGVLDFTKAIASDDQDALKKAWGHFTKRLIAVVILFILPLLVDLILGIVGIETCTM